MRKSYNQKPDTTDPAGKPNGWAPERVFLDSTGLWALPRPPLRDGWATGLGEPVFHAQIYNIFVTGTLYLLLCLYIIAFKNEAILNSDHQ